MGAKSARHHRTLLLRDGPLCAWCGVETSTKGPRETRPSFDHVIPRRLGGSDGVDNGILSCWQCNHVRGHLDFNEFHCGNGFKRAPNPQDDILWRAWNRAVIHAAQVARGRPLRRDSGGWRALSDALPDDVREKMMELADQCTVTATLPLTVGTL